ncbi:NADPH dehydrogenase NamA [Virgibacillus proomii]|uniref:NADPH dehydrogenase NamA n=1 Tax=Virgibacillus proomii TaxID=84407 RepID=UPI001C0F6A80|nr:NADPH dehydrogenase NamA [Virgibacillus proomii]MBU5265338.1 NADPH dehydrogenase NamA [Virgibacillus proomii]
MVKLFSPITLKGITLKNRIVMSPMCMYSCPDQDGMVTPFHKTHYISRAVGQVGLIMLEATAVEQAGRISPEDLGIWDDKHIEGLKQLNKKIQSYGAKTAIQLAHAGRKAELPSTIYAPSAVKYDEQSKQPKEMTENEIKATVTAFKQAAKRAREANFNIIEIHAAHGYLINQFLSPLTNFRTDQYGGTRENRYRFLHEIITAIHTVWKGPLFVRLSTDEYVSDGNTLEDILYFSKRLKADGIDLIDCSSGGVVPVKINVFPGYQVKRCEKIKQEVDIHTGAVGLITSGKQAEEILQNDRADLVFIGRALLRNPYWPKAAADELNYNLQPPTQYERGWK